MRGSRKRNCPPIWLSKVEHPETRRQRRQYLIPVFYSTGNLLKVIYMDKEQIIRMISAKMKLIRNEKGYSQDKMAEILGISKKTLVQIEKGRIQASWTTVVAVCALFRDSQIIQTALGGDPLDIIEIIGRNGIDRAKERTMGGKVWWKDLQRK